MEGGALAAAEGKASNPPYPSVVPSLKGYQMQLELKEVVATAIETSGLDCSDWSKDIRMELALHIIAEVQRAGYQFYEYNPK